MNCNSPDIQGISSGNHHLGRLKGYGGLKILLLHLLREGPKSEAELMDSIEAMSHGHWRPSPGPVRPLFSKAREEELIQKREDGRYELTTAGYTEINHISTKSHPQKISVEGVLKEIESNLLYLEDLPGERIASASESLRKIEFKLKRLIEPIEEGMQNGRSNTGQGSDKNL